MKVAITGLSNSGKTTLFKALTGQNLETTVYPNVAGDPHFGVIKVPDARLDRLSEIFKPKKTTYAIIEYIDYIGITKDNSDQNRKVFDIIRDVDAIVHVVRAFPDDTVLHPLESIDPLRDINTVETELIFGDLELVEKRLERMEEAIKRGKKPADIEKKLMLKCRDSLSDEKALRDVPFTGEEQLVMKAFQFLTTKPEIIVLNTGESDSGYDETAAFQSAVSEMLPAVQSVNLSGRLEMEISQLPQSDARLFLEGLGIDTPASHKLIRACYHALGLITFFTTVNDEVKAWSIRRGTSALNAAGIVHTDIARGFIKAQVISFGDFIASGSMHAVREKGHLRLEGKTYEVMDGDIINFRFNV